MEGNKAAMHTYKFHWAKMLHYVSLARERRRKEILLKTPIHEYY